MSDLSIYRADEDKSPNPRTVFFQHLFRFVIIGLVSVAADYVCYRLLMTAGISPHLAKGLSYVSGMIVGFFGNKYWTFQSKRRSLSEPFAFCGVYLTTLLINVAINGVMLQFLGSEQVVPAYLVATAVSTATNFVGLRFIIFRAGIRENHTRVPAEPAAPVRRKAG